MSIHPSVWLVRMKILEMIKLKTPNFALKDRLYWLLRYIFMDIPSIKAKVYNTYNGQSYYENDIKSLYIKLFLQVI